MFIGIFRIPQPVNEPCLQFAPGSPERTELSSKLQEMLNGQIEVPMIIGGEEVRNGNLADIRCPHNHQHVLGRYHQAEIDSACELIDFWRFNPLPLHGRRVAKATIADIQRI